MATTEKKQANIIHLGTVTYDDARDVVSFQVDDDIYKYLIDGAMLSEASDRSKSTAKTWFNYVKNCPGRCKKNGVEIKHLGVEPKKNK